MIPVCADVEVVAKDVPFIERRVTAAELGHGRFGAEILGLTQVAVGFDATIRTSGAGKCLDFVRVKFGVATVSIRADLTGRCFEAVKAHEYHHVSDALAELAANAEAVRRGVEVEQAMRETSNRIEAKARELDTDAEYRRIGKECPR